MSTLLKKKGEYKGRCNVTACATGYEATWYNYSTQLYYCRVCADRLNSDPFNLIDAMRLFGHELLKEGELHTHKPSESWPKEISEGGLVNFMKKGLLLLSFFLISCKEEHPYEEGMHWNYSIICEDGFKYKVLGHRNGTIPVYNSDGTKLKCDQEKY